MRRTTRLLIVLLSLTALLATALPAAAEHEDRERTRNLHPMGHIVEPRSLLHGDPNIHTDIAFWGRHAFQGSWLGFDIRDVSAPGNPKHVSSTSCLGDQGDVVVWDDVLVRSWNTPAGPGLTCDGQPVPVGFEGLHVFDISDLTDPVLVAAVPLDATVPGPLGPLCGSHTATAVPDLANDRLLVYNSASSAACPSIEVVEVPLGDPASAQLVNVVPAGRRCHDTAVILGDALLAACAGGDGVTVWDLDPADLADPTLKYSLDVNAAAGVSGITIGHTAAFSWDGEVLLFGHEPGGGVQGRCRAEDPDSDKSVFFFAAGTGDFLGTWTLPRDQEAIENCSIHNLNVVPLRDRYVLVAGNYQAGTWVTDFTDPADARALAFSDPAPLVPPDIGGAWSSYWYNNFIYETNITKGLNVFRFSGPETAGARRLDHLNPQTQPFTIP